MMLLSNVLILLLCFCPFYEVSAATKCELNGAVAAASPNETNQYETTDGHNNNSNLDFFGHHFDPTSFQNLMLNRPLASFSTSHHLGGHEKTPPGIGHEHRPNAMAMANLTQKAEQQRPKWAPHIGQSQSRPTRSTTANRYEVEEALKAKNEAENSSQSDQQSSSANSEADNDTTQYESGSDDDDSDSSTELLVEMLRLIKREQEQRNAKKLTTPDSKKTNKNPNKRYGNGVKTQKGTISTDHDQKKKKEPTDLKTKEEPTDQKKKKEPTDLKTKEEPTEQKKKEKATDLKTKEQPTDQKTKEQPTDQKRKKEPTDQKTKEHPTDQKTKEQPTDQKTKEQPTDQKTKEQPTDLKTKEQPTDQKTKEDVGHKRTRARWSSNIFLPTSKPTDQEWKEQSIITKTDDWTTEDRSSEPDETDSDFLSDDEKKYRKETDERNLIELRKLTQIFKNKKKNLQKGE